MNHFSYHLLLFHRCHFYIFCFLKKCYFHDIAEADMQQLNHALKILSETEKQLRMSKNQTTWLTVALLQLSSVGSSLDSSEARLCIKTVQPRGKND